MVTRLWFRLAILLILTIALAVESQSIAGRWIMVDCNAPPVDGSFRTDEEKKLSGCRNAGFPDNVELLKNGSGTVDGRNISWKTHDNNIYITGNWAKVFEYRMFGVALAFKGDYGYKAKYLEAPDDKSGTFTDTRDGKKYKVVKIGIQTWMAENMNFFTKESKCYLDKVENCTRYGRLYSIDEAKIVCPAGWHLPTRGEWRLLIRVAEGTSAHDDDIAGKRLKSKIGWKNRDNGYSGNGTDDYGFSALPGSSIGTAYSNDNFGMWWTASIDNCCYYDDTIAPHYYIVMIFSDDVPDFDSRDIDETYLSVRCIGD